MFNKYKKKLPIYRDGDITRPEDAEGTEGTTSNYFNQKRSKISGQQALGYGQAALGLASNLAANQSLSGEQKNQANAGAVNSTVDSVLGSATPWYGMANTASGLVSSMVKRDANGRPVDAGNQFIDTTAKPMHKSLVEDVSKGDYGSAVGDLFGARNIASIAGLFAPKNERLKDMASGEQSLFAMGGQQPCYNCGGMHQYAQGGINAEVEKQENTLNPDGSTNQYDGSSHENGGIKTHLDPGTLIFSDKLKHQGKTFAALNKPNNTSKEDKILGDPNASNSLKQTAQLMKDTKIKNSLSLFQIQEELKQTKFNNYQKRLGGIQQYPWGGAVDAKGFPIDATGRRLTAEEQMGFNRPSYSYGQNSTERLGTTNYGATKQFGLTDPNYNTILKQNTLPVFNYNAGSNATYQQQQQDYLKANNLVNVGTFGNGGKYPMYRRGDKTPDGGTSYFNEDGISQEQIDRMNKLSQGRGDNSRPFSDNSNRGDSHTRSGSVEPKGNTQYNTTNDSPNWFNRNKDNLYQLGFGLAQNAGQLAYLGEQGKKYDTQQFYNYSPDLLNPTAALNDAEHENRLAALNVRDASGGNAGTYLSNRVALNAQNVLNKDRIRQQYANQNAQISNQGKQFNIQSKYSVDDINAQNKGRALSNYYSTLGSVGTNVAQGMKDNRSYNMDKEAIGMLPAMFDNPAYAKYIDEYLSTKGYKKSKTKKS